TSFIGRSAELARASSLIAQHRLVTIAGPGGVGKSRLALEAGFKVGARDGVWLIDLAGVQDTALIDGCQTLLPPLLQAAPGLRVLATSRVVLGCMGEQVLDLSPLEVPRSGLR